MGARPISREDIRLSPGTDVRLEYFTHLGKGSFVFFPVKGSHAVFRNNEPVIPQIGVIAGKENAIVGGEAAEHDGSCPHAFKQKVQAGGVKGGIFGFDDKIVVRCRADGVDDGFAPAFQTKLHQLL